MGHHIPGCPVRFLHMAGADASFSRWPFGGGLKRSRGNMAGTPVGKGGPLRGGSVLGYVNRCRAPVGGAPLDAR